MLPQLGTLLVVLAARAAADLASIQSALDTINSGLRNLDTALISLNQGTAGSLLELGQASVPVLQNATQIIMQSAPLSLSDVQSLSTSTAALRQNVNLTINDFIAQKPLFDSLQTSPLVLQGLQGSKDAAVQLGQALVSKFPPEAATMPQVNEQTTAAVGELAAIFDRGIGVFSGVDPSAAQGVGPVPVPATPPSPSDLTTIPLPVPMGGMVTNGAGTVGPDGSCVCAAQCPAGSFL